MRRQLGFIRCRAKVGARYMYLIDGLLHERFSRPDINRLSGP